jgi:hypothetical protein
MMRKNIFAILGILLCLCTSVSAQKFTAFVNKDKVALNDNFQVTFKLEGAQSKNITAPSFDDFTVLGAPMTSSSMQFVNGQTTQSVSYSYFLRPKKQGKLTIGSATVTINGKELKTKPLTIEVVAAGQSAQSGNGQRQTQNQDIEEQLKENLFVKARFNKRDVYVGEQLTVTYDLFRRVRTVNLNMDEPPRYEGFWVENVELKGAMARKEEIDGVQYEAITIKKDILIPQRAGQLKIDAMKLSCVVQVQTQPSRRRSIFDSFFNSYQNYEYVFSANTLRINVKPLPLEGKPANFSGLVGDFNLDVSLDKQATETGEPITFRVKYTGTGNIKSVREPMLDFPPDFDVYDPKIDEAISKSGSVLSGRRNFDYLVLPRNPGEFKMPILNFTYFDPKAEAYITRNSPEYTLVVTGEPEEASVNTINMSKEDIELIGEDIRFIKTGEGNLTEKGESFAGSLPFYGLYLTPFLLLVFLFMMKKRQDSALEDVAGTRRKKATKMARKRLSVAEKFITDKNEKGFYNEVVRAMWGYLGDKLTMGQSDLSRDNIGKVITEKGGDEMIVKRVTDLLDTCEMALFAPSAAVGGMQGTYDEAVNLISDLEGILA